MTTSFKDVLNKIAKDNPGVRITPAEEYTSASYVRRPTSVCSLDLATRGGLPAGGITEIWGPENAGKNMMVDLIIARNQEIHQENSSIAYCAVEYGLDKPFARKLGVTIPYSAEELLSIRENGIPIEEEQPERGMIHTISAQTGEKLLEAVADMVATDSLQLIIIDSIGAVLAEDEKEHSLDDYGMANTALPRLMARFNRKLSGAFYEQPNGRPNLTTIIVTNQITAKMGGRAMPGAPAPVQEKGGQSLRHSKLLSIKITRGATIKEGLEPVGFEVKWKLTKGKAGCSDGASGSFFYNWEKGPDLENDALEACKQCGLIIVGGGGYYSFPLYDVQERGRDNFLNRLRGVNPYWYKEAYSMIMNSVKIPAVHTWPEGKR